MDWQTLATRLEEQCKTLRYYDSDSATSPSPAAGESGTEQLCHTLGPTCEAILDVLGKFKYGRCDATVVVRKGGHALEHFRSVAELIRSADAIFSEQCSGLVESLQAIPNTIDITIKQRQDFYVYAHCDREGTPFYIGVGWDKSAWSVERKSRLWHYYVCERLHGHYEVAILRSGLTADKADAYKEQLIEQYGEQLVNLEGNPYRSNTAACRRYYALRDANQRFIAETWPFERTDPGTAVARYREAIGKMREYESINVGEGLAGELFQAISTHPGEPGILNRLTLCLLRLGRIDEAIQEAEAYFAEFPDAREHGFGPQILRRVERARSKRERG
jgi:hypothetical protein